MSILPPLLFGISASLDALLVGIALGLQKVPLPARHNLHSHPDRDCDLYRSWQPVVTLVSHRHRYPDRKQCTDPFRSLLRGEMAAFQMVLQFFPG